MWHDPDDHALERRSFALRIKRAANENVALGIVHCRVAGLDLGEFGRPDTGH